MQVTQALCGTKHFALGIALSARTAWLYPSQALPDDAAWWRLMQHNVRFFILLLSDNSDIPCQGRFVARMLRHKG